MTDPSMLPTDTPPPPAKPPEPLAQPQVEGGHGTVAPLPPPSRRTRLVWGAVLAGGLALLVAALVWSLGHREERAAEAPPAAKLQRAGEEVAVVLDSAALRRAGIRTVLLGAATGGAAAAGRADSAVTEGRPLEAALGLTGELVADPGRITTIRSAVPGRLTAPSGRWPALGESVAAGAVVAQVSDARPLVAPRGGVVTAVSAQPGELVQAGQELLRLADLSTLLARMAWRPDAPPPPASLRIVPLSAGGAAVAGWPARLVGPAAEVDSLTRQPVYLYRLSGVSAGVRPGLPVTALVSERAAGGTALRASAPSAAGGTARAGARTVLVPTDAVVQWQGLAWVFVQRAPGRFVRVRVDTTRPTAGGWLVAAASAPTPDALAVGDAVVVQGAQQLLSAEFRSQLPKEEEGA